MVAYQCNAIPRFLPNKWSFKQFDNCPENVRHPVEFLEIWRNVSLEAFLWGLGTAIGELPPYFMAKAAKSAKDAKDSKKFDEQELLKEEENEGFFGKITNKLKKIITEQLKKRGFITVLLCASIPNPLFDLAGILCGTFGIPFIVFFGATFIGKAIFKVSI